MGPATRETRRVYVAQEDAGSSSSEENFDEREGGEDEVAFVSVRPNGIRKPITISLREKKQCKVCKKYDHCAGFVGSVYVDCPNKPCYVCKLPGHTTANCPHNCASNKSLPKLGAKLSGELLGYLFRRELKGSFSLIKKFPPIPNRVDMAMLRLHERRINALEFHPQYDHFVISGDKRGHIGVWNFEKGHEKNVYSNIHFYQINSIKFPSPNDFTALTSSTDGKICLTDLETGFSENLLVMSSLDHGDVSTNAESFFGMDVNLHLNCAVSADDVGNLYRFDIRNPNDYMIIKNAHKPCSKISSLQFNPRDDNLLISSGNDYMVHIWDIRMMSEKIQLATLKHPRVVNSSFFSPITGSKILTTCQDNRLRVWDSLYQNLDDPSREIVHSHDFHRYVTAFRAEWDPKDPHERVMVCGRFISDDYQGVALHPIDFIDASTGLLICAIHDHNLTTISAVNKPHPRLDLLATGSSRSIYIWKPDHEEKAEEELNEDEAIQKDDMFHGDISSQSRIKFFDAGETDNKRREHKRKLVGNNQKPRKKARNMEGDDDDEKIDDEEEDDKPRKIRKGSGPSPHESKKKQKPNHGSEPAGIKSSVPPLGGRRSRKLSQSHQKDDECDDHEKEPLDSHSFFDQFKSRFNASTGVRRSRRKLSAGNSLKSGVNDSDEDREDDSNYDPSADN